MPLVELHRSQTSAACEQRAFVLRAVGIATDIVMLDGSFALFVQADDEVAARHHLERYAAENAAPFKSPPSPHLHEHAWIAPLLYGCSLVLIAFLAGRNTFSLDWYTVGGLTSSLEKSNEWWRAVTALTLHVDHDHLLRNIGFGALFAYPAARLLGAGVAFMSMIFAAIFGNILDSLLMPATHVSIGASTIVFATLGLISAYSWRLQFSARMRWAHRWAPLVIGIALLGLIGSGGEHTDVLGHLTGFFCGALFGVALARVP
ncbi:MAG TPA: rhomboid family intramembrane serine protease, partial [Steroidobacteraceae bacterium]|nr:rhomboid family intramembrane serine protease [Steroidobacteraceae bacterium]